MSLLKTIAIIWFCGSWMAIMIAAVSETKVNKAVAAVVFWPLVAFIWIIVNLVTGTRDMIADIIRSST
jgi:hypothetical protein